MEEGQIDAYQLMMLVASIMAILLMAWLIYGGLGTVELPR